MDGMLMQVPITEEHYERFKEAYRGYVKLFELSDFNHTIHKARLEDAAATVQIDSDGRTCLVTLCEEVSEPYLEENSMEDWAMHEALHVLLADFSNTSRDPAVSDRLKDRAEEALVVKLENILRNYR